MKLVQIVYSPTARDYLRSFQPSLKASLREAVEELVTSPLKGKPLQDEFEGFRSHRFKRYRVIYRYIENKRRIEILFAGPRRDVYVQFSRYLKNLKK